MGVGIDDRTETIVVDETMAIANLVHAGEFAVLAVASGHGIGTTYSLQNEVVQIGRHPDSDIFLDDVTVSRRHAHLKRLGDEYVLSDAGSLNGTYVNQERCESATLRQGDEVQVGKFKLVYFPPGSQDESVD